jgi:hypothetical protein
LGEQAQKIPCGAHVLCGITCDNHAKVGNHCLNQQDQPTSIRKSGKGSSKSKQRIPKYIFEEIRLMVINESTSTVESTFLQINK